MSAAAARRYYDELWNQWRLELADELLAADVRFRGSLAVEVQGIAGFKRSTPVEPPPPAKIKKRRPA